MTGKTGHGAKLPRKAEEAIAALLRFGTIEQAAESIGVAEVTLRRWLKDPGFRSAYQEARRQVVEHATAQLQQLSNSLTKTLKAIEKDEKAPPSARVVACRTVLELAQRGVEMEELVSRVEVLERCAESKNQGITPIRATR